MNLAGFDVILELSRSTLTESINESNMIRRHIENTLPFPEGNVNMNMFLTGVEIVAINRTTQAIIRLKFDKTFMELPNQFQFSMLGGQIDIEVPIIVTAANQQNRSFIGVDLTHNNTTLIFNSDSEQRIIATLGKDRADTFKNQLRQFIALDMLSRGVVTTNFSFIVIPGVNSSSPMQLTTEPEIMWIDNDTLGIFGFLRANPSGGDVNLRTHSNRDITNPRSAAFLLSSQGFHSTVACQAIHNMAVQQVIDNNWQNFVDEERKRNNNPGPATEEETKRAKEALDQFLVNEKGIQSIESSTPAPCGPGSLSQHVEMPDPFPATTAHVHFLDITLGKGQINILAKAHAEIFCGSIDIEMPMSTVVSIEQGRLVAKQPTKEEPKVDTNASVFCEAGIGFLLVLLTGPIIGAILTILITFIIELIADSIITNKAKNGPIPFPGVGIEVRDDFEMDSIFIEEDGILIQGTIPWKLGQGNNEVPSVKIVVEALSPEPSKTILPQQKTYQFPGTKYGCPPQTFEYTVSHWNTAWKMYIEAEDVALPVKVNSWFATQGYSFGLDPRPSYNGSTAEISAPLTYLSGQVSFQDPPSSNGRVERRPAIPLQVTGTKQEGWTIKASGEDGNFFLHLEAEVEDASGQIFHAEQFVNFNGESVTFGSNYEAAMEECNKKYKEWSAVNRIKERQVSTTPVSIPKWDPIETMATSIRESIIKKEPGIIKTVSQIITQHGEHVSQLILQTPVTNDDLQRFDGLVNMEK